MNYLLLKRENVFSSLRPPYQCGMSQTVVCVWVSARAGRYIYWFVRLTLLLVQLPLISLLSTYRCVIMLLLFQPSFLSFSRVVECWRGGCRFYRKRCPNTLGLRYRGFRQQILRLPQIRAYVEKSISRSWFWKFRCGNKSPVYCTSQKFFVTPIDCIRSKSFVCRIVTSFLNFQLIVAIRS